MSSLTHKVWLLTGRKVPQPALDLNLLAGSLPAGMTFTRAAGPATYFDATGTLQTAGTNVPRFDNDPVTHAPLGLLIEEARTNILTNSQAINSWPTKTDTTVTDNSTTSPDGTVNASLCTEGGLGTASLISNVAAVSAGATVTTSCFVKRGNTNLVRIGAYDGTGGTNGGRLWFNTATGVIGTVAAFGSATSPFATVTPLLAGWYRVTVTVTMPAGVTTAALFASTANADGSLTRVNNGTYYIWGAQTEVAAFPTSYIPTAAGAATRPAELALISPVPGYNGPASTMVAEAVAPALPGKSVTLLSLTDAVPNKITLFTNASNIPAMFASTGLNQTLGASIVANAVNKIGGAFANGAQRGAYNGAITNAAIATIPQASTTLCIGSDLTGSQSNNWIRRARYWPQALNATQLQQVTR